MTFFDIIIMLVVVIILVILKSIFTVNKNEKPPINEKYEEIGPFEMIKVDSQLFDGIEKAIRRLTEKGRESGSN